MLPVDQEFFRVALGQIIRARGVGITVKEWRIQRDRLIEGGVLIPRRGAEDGIQPVSYADLRESPEGRLLGAVIFPDRVDKAHHPLLGQVLAVPSRQEKGPGTGADHPVVPGDQDLLRLPDAAGGQDAEFFIAPGLQICHGMVVVGIVHK